MKPKDKPRCSHTWTWIGETTQSTNEWCESCGAWKRTADDGKVTIMLSKLLKSLI